MGVEEDDKIKRLESLEASLGVEGLADKLSKAQATAVGFAEKLDEKKAAMLTLRKSTNFTDFFQTLKGVIAGFPEYEYFSPLPTGDLGTLSRPLCEQLQKGFVAMQPVQKNSIEVYLTTQSLRLLVATGSKFDEAEVQGRVLGALLTSHQAGELGAGATVEWALWKASTHKQDERGMEGTVKVEINKIINEGVALLLAQGRSLAKKQYLNQLGVVPKAFDNWFLLNEANADFADLESVLWCAIKGFFKVNIVGIKALPPGLKAKFLAVKKAQSGRKKAEDAASGTQQEVKNITETRPALPPAMVFSHVTKETKIDRVKEGKRVEALESRKTYLVRLGDTQMTLDFGSEQQLAIVPNLLGSLQLKKGHSANQRCQFISVEGDVGTEENLFLGRGRWSPEDYPQAEFVKDRFVLRALGSADINYLLVQFFSLPENKLLGQAFYPNAVGEYSVPDGCETARRRRTIYYQTSTTLDQQFSIEALQIPSEPLAVLQPRLLTERQRLVERTFHLPKHLTQHQADSFLVTTSLGATETEPQVALITNPEGRLVVEPRPKDGFGASQREYLKVDLMLASKDLADLFLEQVFFQDLPQVKAAKEEKNWVLRMPKEYAAVDVWEVSIFAPEPKQLLGKLFYKNTTALAIPATFAGKYDFVLKGFKHSEAVAANVKVQRTQAPETVVVKRLGQQLSLEGGAWPTGMGLHLKSVKFGKRSGQQYITWQSFAQPQDLTTTSLAGDEFYAVFAVDEQAETVPPEAFVRLMVEPVKTAPPSPPFSPKPGGAGSEFARKTLERGRGRPLEKPDRPKGTNWGEVEMAVAMSAVNNFRVTGDQVIFTVDPEALDLARVALVGDDRLSAELVFQASGGALQLRSFLGQMGYVPLDPECLQPFVQAYKTKKATEAAQEKAVEQQRLDALKRLGVRHQIQDFQLPQGNGFWWDRLVKELEQSKALEVVSQSRLGVTKLIWSHSWFRIEAEFNKSHSRVARPIFKVISTETHMSAQALEDMLLGRLYTVVFEHYPDLKTALDKAIEDQQAEEDAQHRAKFETFKNSTAFGRIRELVQAGEVVRALLPDEVSGGFREQAIKASELEPNTRIILQASTLRSKGTERGFSRVYDQLGDPYYSHAIYQRLRATIKALNSEVANDKTRTPFTGDHARVLIEVLAKAGIDLDLITLDDSHNWQEFEASVGVPGSRLVEAFMDALRAHNLEASFAKPFVMSKQEILANG